MIFEIYALYNEASQYKSQELIKMHREIDNPLLMWGILTLPLLVTDRSSRQKISKDSWTQQNHPSMDLLDSLFVIFSQLYF